MQQQVMLWFSDLIPSRFSDLFNFNNAFLDHLLGLQLLGFTELAKLFPMIPCLLSKRVRNKEQKRKKFTGSMKTCIDISWFSMDSLNVTITVKHTIFPIEAEKHAIILKELDKLSLYIWIIGEGGYLCQTTRLRSKIAVASKGNTRYTNLSNYFGPPFSY